MVALAALGVLALLAAGCVFDGTWVAVDVPGPSVGYNVPADVDCVAADWCLAVGSGSDDDDGNDDGAAYARRWDGSEWHDVPQPDGDFALKVDCAVPDRCIGLVGEHDGDTELLMAFDGDGWTVVPPGANTIGDPAPFACAADGSCVIVQGEADRTTVWDGVTFTEVPFADGGPADPAAQVMACQSETDCLAVAEDGATARWNGASWTSLGVTAVADPSGISCPTPAWCLVVGGGANEATATWDGSAWTAEVVPAAVDTYLADVSCVSSAECVALGSVWVRSFSSKRPVELGWNGSDWFVATEAPGGPRATYDAISCVPRTCVAVGFVGPETGDIQEALAATYTWTTP